MITVLVTLLLAAAALVSPVTGQTLDANGCVLLGGVYDPVSKLCRCKPNYGGVGDIYCAPDNEHDICVLTGDPTLHSINNQRVALNVPCSVCINVMHGKTASGKECVWEVLSSASIQDQGAMYSSMIKIAVSINKKTPTYFEFDGNNVGDPESNSFDLGADGKTSVEREGETIHLSHDASAGLWTMEGCQNKMVFRPKKDGVSGSPGVYMEASKGSTKMSLQQGNLCNLKDTFDNSLPWNIGVLDSALNMRLNFNQQQKASLPDYDATCANVDHMLETFCQGISDQAMMKCSQLLYQSDIRYCLDGAGVKGQDMLTIFYDCLETYCDGESSLCQKFKNIPAVKTCVPHLTDCEDWPMYF